MGALSGHHLAVCSVTVSVLEPRRVLRRHHAVAVRTVRIAGGSVQGGSGVMRLAG